MGRGDKRTKKGKISMGTFGKFRLARRKRRVVAPKSIEKTEE